MKRLAQLILVCCAFLGSMHTAQAAQVKDPVTGVPFDDVIEQQGIHFHCLGAGVRKKFFIHVYNVAFCVDASAKASLSQVVAPTPDETAQQHERRLQDSPAFYDSFGSVPGAKMVVMHVLHDVSREKLAGAFRESLDKILAPDKIEKLVAITTSDASANQTIYIVGTAEGTLHMSNGESHTSLSDQEITKKLWQVWLGPNGVSPSLKASLARWRASVPPGQPADKKS